jgi:hypothetical protein
LVDEGAECIEVVFVDLVERERVHGELSGGAGEEALGDVADELILSLVLGNGGMVDVRLAGFFALDEAFVGHDLEELEDRGVAEGAAGADLVVDVADGGGAAVPEDAEELEFAFGGARELGVSLHEKDNIRRDS